MIQRQTNKNVNQVYSATVNKKLQKCQVFLNEK